MPIPTYDSLMLPVLRHCADKAWVMRDLVKQVADDLNLSQGEREQQLPSNGTTLIASRVHWAKTYLKQAGLVEQPKRGIVQISRQGQQLLDTNPQNIDVEILKKYPKFQEFMVRTKTSGSISASVPDADTSLIVPSSTPEEQIAAASGALDEALRDALIARVLEAPPAFFERMIIDLLLAMGYGGSKAEAGEQLGGTGDGGVDGVIREDQLGLDRVYLQAKRYKPGNTVGSEAVQAFIGALVGRGAQKGVMITTSSFSRAATLAASQSGSLRIVLIDGTELMRLLVRFKVGVRVAQTVEIMRVDLDYFEGTDSE